MTCQFCDRAELLPSGLCPACKTMHEMPIIKPTITTIAPSDDADDWLRRRDELSREFPTQAQ
jgi:hypothetical protein